MYNVENIRACGFMYCVGCIKLKEEEKRGLTFKFDLMIIGPTLSRDDTFTMGPYIR